MLLILALACAFALAPSAALAAPPANDDFANAQTFTGSASVPGTNVEATKQTGEPNHAGNPGGHSIWYRWTAPNQQGVVFIFTCDSAIDTVLGVYSGSSVGSLTHVGSNDDESVGCSPEGPTQQSAVSFAPVPGQTYHIAVDGKNGVTGNINFGITFTASGGGGGSTPPSNDDRAAAEDLFPNADSDSVSTLNATKEIGEPSHAGNGGGHSVWYRLQAPTNGNVTLNTCSSNFDTLLAVYTDDGTSLTEVASNDNTAGCGTGGNRSQVSFAATSGEVYFIAVDGRGGSAGSATIGLSSNFSIFNPPANNDRADAETLTGELDSDSVINTDADKEVGEPDHAGNPGGHSVWYRWVAPSDGDVTIETCGSDIDTLLAVYPDSSNTPVAESDDAVGCGDGSGGSVTFAVAEGDVYDIAVDGKDGATGALGVGLTHSPTVIPPPPNDNRSAPEVLAGASDTASGTNVAATKEAGEPAHAGNVGGASVWYRWTAPDDGTVVVDVCASGFDTLLAAYRGNGSTNPLAQNDNTTGCGGGTRSQVSFDVVGGQAYDIAVDGKIGATGSVELSLAFTVAPPSPPANDDFAAATVLPAADTSAGGDNEDAGKQAGEPDHAGNAGGASVWFSWTAPGNGSVSVYTCSSSFDTLLGVYTGASVDALTPVASNDDSAGCGGGTRSYVTFPVTSGTEYRIAVDGKSGASGPLALTVDFTATPVDPGDGGGGGGTGGGGTGGGSGGGGGADTAGGGGTGGGNTGAPALSTSLSARSLPLRRLLRRGLVVRFGCSQACSVRFALRAPRRGVIGRGSARLATTGSGRVVIRLSRRVKRRLRHARSLSLTLTMTATDSAGRRQTKTARPRARR